MVVKTLHGQKTIFHGTPKSIVLQMTREDFLCGGKTNYMAEVKTRLKAVYELDIDHRPRSFVGFLRELERHEFIEIKKDS